MTCDGCQVGLTIGSLEPSADVEDGGGVHEEEQEEGAEAEEDDEDGEGDKEGGGTKGGSGDGGKVIQSSLTQQVLTILKQAAGFPESEVPGPFAALRVPQPLGLNEDHDVDDGVTHGEHSPQHSDGPGVTQMLQLVIMIR